MALQQAGDCILADAAGLGGRGSELPQFEEPCLGEIAFHGQNLRVVAPELLTHAVRGLLRAFFDRILKFEFHGSRITSDAGLLAYRELDEALGLTTLAGDVIADSRTGKNGWHGIIGLARPALSCRSLRNNAVRLQLHALAYNLGNFMRKLTAPRPGRLQ